jgi:hypothetical protein
VEEAGPVPGSPEQLPEVDSCRTGEADPFRKLTEEEIAQLIERRIRQGVSVSCRNWREHDMTVTEIHWRPGDPNVLAETIINNVRDEDMQLVLDGNTYVVRKA